jgi:DNA-binding NarL/FixJ family response regulator
MEQDRSAVLSYNTDVATLFTDVLVQSGYERPQCSAELGVAKLGTYRPRVLMIDFDHVHGDKLESIRRIRFVLPECAIAVVSSNFSRGWARKCHMAGANGVLPAGHTVDRLVKGLHHAVNTGCFTDSAFTSAANGRSD